VTPHRLLLTAAPDSEKPDLHRRTKVPSRHGCAKEEAPPPAVRIPNSDEFDRLVPSVTQLPLASSAAAVGRSPCQSPRLLKVKAPKLSDVLVAVKSEGSRLQVGRHQHQRLVSKGFEALPRCKCVVIEDQSSGQLPKWHPTQATPSQGRVRELLKDCKQTSQRSPSPSPSQCS
jgi:hypothetical protein